MPSKMKPKYREKNAYKGKHVYKKCHRPHHGGGVGGLAPRSSKMARSIADLFPLIGCSVY